MKTINEFPNDINGITQGLEFTRIPYYESTGKKGMSSLRKIGFDETGKILQTNKFRKTYLGRGIPYSTINLYAYLAK